MTASASSVEVTKIGIYGFWLWIEGQEHFVPFAEFPWFKDSTVAEILEVERHGPDHLHWRALDVDLTLDMIENPNAHPLVYR